MSETLPRRAGASLRTGGIGSAPIAEMVAAARAMAPTLRAQAREVEAARRTPEATIRAFRDAGFFRILQPQKFGGYGSGFSDLVQVSFELAQACGSSAWCASLGMAHQWFAALFPLRGQEELWADPSNIVAGVYAPMGKCERVEGGYQVAGRWPYASNCDNSGWYILGAMLPPDEDHPAPEVGLFLIPADQARIEDTWHMAGLAGTGSKTVAIDAPLFVPDHRMLRRPEMTEGCAPGSRADENPIYRVPFYAALPYCIVAPCVGMARGAVDAFAEWAARQKSRTVAVDGALGQASAAVEAAWRLVRTRLAETEDRLLKGQALTLQDRVENRRDQAFAVHLAQGAVNTLMDAMGSSAFDLEGEVQRQWRDLNVAAHHISVHWTEARSQYGQFRAEGIAKGAY